MTHSLYAVTNRQSANAVVGMRILRDGELEFLPGSPYLTGGRGSRSSQSQHGIWIHGDLVFAVDFGSDSFAIFRKSADGALMRLNDAPISSQGTRPCSLCVSDDILYVVNQHIRSSGSRAEPNLAVFALRGESVRHLPDSSFKLLRGESPTQVIANPQGTVLAIPSVRARRSLLHCYEIRPASRAGLLVEFENSPFEIADAGFGFGSVWASDGKTLFMTNAIGAGSVLRLAIDVGSRRIEERARATTPGNACWTALSRDGKRLYVTNLLSLIVFDVSGERLEQLQSLDVEDIPNPVLRDLALTPEGRFLYAIEQRRRRILRYAVGRDGRVALHGELAVGSPGYTLGLAIG
jgi:6-phosphogluconolactonase (cycloisomerase 2 family)